MQVVTIPSAVSRDYTTEHVYVKQSVERIFYRGVSVLFICKRDQGKIDEVFQQDFCMNPVIV